AIASRMLLVSAFFMSVAAAFAPALNPLDSIASLFIAIFSCLSNFSLKSLKNSFSALFSFSPVLTLLAPLRQSSNHTQRALDCRLGVCALLPQRLWSPWTLALF